MKTCLILIVAAISLSSLAQTSTNQPWLGNPKYQRISAQISTYQSQLDKMRSQRKASANLIDARVKAHSDATSERARLARIDSDINRLTAWINKLSDQRWLIVAAYGVKPN